jgi:glucose-6-phosphate dehydrogenase assembly protein OpcA
MAEALKMIEDDFFSGIPVAVDPERIDRELAKLWKPEPAARKTGQEWPASHPTEQHPQNGEEEGPAVTRACLSNLVIYLPDQEAFARARSFLPQLGRRFPSRMILLTHGDGEEGAGALSASLAAVCHVPSPGLPPVCCEQIALAARDQSLDVFPGAVTPLLVPDLPVILAMGSAGGERLVELLGEVADRVIFDSRLAPLFQLKRICSLLDEGKVFGVDDFAWRDIMGWRRVLCDFFDHPEARHMLDSLRRIEVEYQRKKPAEGSSEGTEGATRAALIAGWLTSRLGWRFSKAEASMVDFSAAFSKNRKRLHVFLRPAERSEMEPGQILTVHLVAGEKSKSSYLTVLREEKANILRLDYHTGEACVIPRRIPFRRETDAELLGGALERLTHQAVLREAFRIASQMG